jgi:SAM-dependent methyltransferase
MTNEHHHHGHTAEAHHGAAADHAGEADPAAAMVEMLDLDAEVLRDYLAELTGWIHAMATDPSPRRILDLGCGTGTGTIALAREFADADITAVDASETMLHHLTIKTRDLGLTARIHPVRADLDVAWPALEPIDLVWASASLHHMADPDRVLADVFASLAPGGRLVVVEIDSFPRFLPDDLGIGRPGLEDRCYTALKEERAAHLPHLGSDWGPSLAKAGLAIEAEREFTIDLKSPLPAAAGRYAIVTLGRMRGAIASRLSADDLAILDALVSPDGPDS